MSRPTRLLLISVLLLGCGGIAAYVQFAKGPRRLPGSGEAQSALPAFDEPTTTQPSTTPPLPGHWKLVFDDEFTGPSLSSIWTPHQYWDEGATVGEGDEQSDPANVQLFSGSLQLTAKRDRTFNTPYTGALVQAGGIRGKRSATFSFLHGYAEARIRVPIGRGLWPAFWLMPASYHDANGEIDIIDNGTGNPLVLHGGALRKGRQDQHQHSSKLSLGFHTFAVDWEADHVAWFVDGKPWARTTDTSLICPEPMYPIFDLAVGGKWGGPPDATTHFPAVMEVDWIRIWQRS